MRKEAKWAGCRVVRRKVRVKLGLFVHSEVAVLRVSPLGVFLFLGWGGEGSELRFMCCFSRAEGA